MIGGKSIRLGSDKGLFNFMGKPLISYQIEIVSQLTNEIFLVANSKEQVRNYIEKIDISNILAFIIDESDLVPDPKFRNPMLGLYSTFKELNKLQYEKVFVLSCDNPVIQPQVIKFLLDSCVKNDCCIPKWENGFLEPLFAIYPVALALPRAEKCIKRQKFKLTNIIDEKWNITYIPIEQSIKMIDPDLLSFKNLNEIEQMNNLKNILNKFKKKNL